MEDGSVVQLKNTVVNNRIYLKKEELPQGRITAMSVMNTSEQAQEVKLTIFNLGIPEGALDTDPRSIYDADIATPYFCSKAALDVTRPVPEGATELIVVGNVNLNITNATLTKAGEHVRRYKLTPGAKEVRLTHPKQNYGFVNEIIFK
jgi:hypothetical protein